MNNIIWLASYPKSGNTWLRLIISALLFTDDGRLKDFDLLKKITKFDKLKFFDFIKGISLSDYEIIFKNKEVDDQVMLTIFKYSIEAQRTLCKQDRILFFKTHNARIKMNDYYYTDKSTTLGYIYISRDPRDVAISYSKYLKQDCDDIIEYLTNGQIRGKKIEDGLFPEIHLNWSNHYLSWKNFNQVPRLFLKYENFLADLEIEILKIVNFLENNFNLNVDNKTIKIKNIVENTDFNFLKKLEKEKGFEEAPDHIKSNFFRKGKTQQWVNDLNSKQINKIEKSSEFVMKELGYI